MVKVLFVCTGNTCRSVMAQALLKREATKRKLNIKVDSAGLATFNGDPASEHAVTVMAEHGVDISDHRSQQLDFEKISDYDLILTMTNGHKQHLLSLRPDLVEKVFMLKEFAALKRKETAGKKEKLKNNGSVLTDYDVNDPFGQSKTIYHHTATELLQAIENIIDFC